MLCYQMAVLQYNQMHDDILQELANSIGQIDFKILAFSDIEDVIQKIETLKPYVFNEDGSFNKTNKTEFDEYKKLCFI